ncbi:MAG: TIGR04255 family protein [Pseudomonadales bacterium]|nr:TIGR04255 family protein [Pseudomonadales bacterium]
MGKKMSNAPVFFTLAQVRFNPLLKLNDCIPDIQEKLRVAHFPDFRQENVQVVAFQNGGTNTTQQARYVFGDIPGTSSFVLDNNSLAFQTTDYETFTEFSERVELGIKTLNDSIPNGLDYVSRLGIRYFDAVQPQSGDALSQYLVKEVMGLSESVQQLTHSFSETMSKSEHGTLITRVIIRDGQLALPAELHSLAPQLDEKFLAHRGRHAIVDSDAFNDRRQAFDLSSIMTNLTGLHDDIKSSFKELITDHALTVWE